MSTVVGISPGWFVEPMTPRIMVIGMKMSCLPRTSRRPALPPTPRANYQTDRVM